MTRIDKDMQVGEALWILGVREVKDHDAFMRGIFKKAERFDRYLESIKDTVPHVSLADYEVLEDKLEAAQEWAYHMGLMYEDCAYMSREEFEKDAKVWLATLVGTVGKWVPPEMRG